MYRERLSAFLMVTLVLAGVSADDQRPAETSVRRALLVGCSEYDLPRIRDLVGPANDVVLMRNALVERFKFDDDQIVTLSEFMGKKDERLRPTKGNIKREFENLVNRSKAGDQVFILLAGHGFQQPDSWPPAANDIEPDGLDEAFAPADTKQDENGELTNIILDDELRMWLGEITTRGAAV